MNRVSVAVVAASILLLVGCGSMGAARGDWDPFRQSQERQLLVTVENLSTRNVTVSVLAPGRRERLGTLDPRTREFFQVTWSSTQEVRFHLDPLGSSSHTTTPFTVGPGEHVEVVVQEPVSRSIVRR